MNRQLLLTQKPQTLQAGDVMVKTSIESVDTLPTSER